MTATAIEADLNGPAVVLEFGAPWCSPCRQLEPILVELAQEYRGIRFISLDIEDEHDARIAQRFNVRSAATVLLLRDGEVVGQFIGAQPKATIVRHLAVLSPL